MPARGIAQRPSEMAQMTDPKAVLGMPGGRVLDVATGRGGMIQFLIDGLESFDEIVGIDNDPDTQAGFMEASGDRPNVRFVLMDATALEFEDGSFDTVCLGSSLHHCADPVAILREMRRVCREGGNVIVVEMYRDGQHEPQVTHVELHHWWAAIDTLGGRTHDKTFTRAEVLALVDVLALDDLRIEDLVDSDADPMSPDRVAELDPVIDRYLALADGHADLQAQGEALRRRLHGVGFRLATSVCAIGRA